MIEIPHLRQLLAGIFEIPAAETRQRVVEEIELRRRSRRRDGSITVYGTRPGKIEPEPIPTTYEVNWIGPENTTDYAPCAERQIDLNGAWASEKFKIHNRDRYDRLFVASEDWEQILKRVDEPRSTPKRGGRPPSPLWELIRPAALKWLKKHGVPQLGDGTQAQFEAYLKERAAKRNEYPAESTIREWAKVYMADLQLAESR